MIEINDDEYLLFKTYMQENWGIDIPIDKKYLFYTRLNNFFHSGEYKNFIELYNNLIKENNPILKNKIIELMTTNETTFFRDKHPFDSLKENILPTLYADYVKQKVSFPFRLKIWSAGCSTGQEAYSLAMIISDWSNLKSEISPDKLKIVATDISQEVLNKAIDGKYSDKDIKKGMRDEYINKYVHQCNGSWEITKEIKKMVDFKKINLSEKFDDSFSNFDIIFCRNVIIYFSNEIRVKILKHFHSALNENGYLIVGASENLYGYTDEFEPIHIGPSTIYKVKK